MIERIQRIGWASRPAVAARLSERGTAVRVGRAPELVLLCVPDRRSATWPRGRAGPVDRARERGDAARRARPARAPVQRASAADVHGARPRAARRRLGRGDRRDRRGARAPARGSPRRSGCGRSSSPTTGATLYHAGAAIASNFLVTLYRAAARAVRDGRRAARGARAADAAHDRERLRADGPDHARRLGDGRRAPRRDPRRAARARAAVRALAEATRRSRREDVRTIGSCAPSSRRARRSGSCRRWARCTRATSRSFRAARAECDAVVAQPLREPGAVRRPGRPRRVSARRGARRRGSPTEAGVDVLFAPDVDEIYPPGYATSVEVEEARARARGRRRPGHFRGVATVCLKLFNIVRPDARVLRPEGRAAGGRDPAGSCATSISTLEIRVAADGARRGRARAVVAQRPALAGRAERALAHPAGARRRAPRAPAAAIRWRPPGARWPAWRSSTSSWPISTAARARGRRPRRHDPPDRQCPSSKEQLGRAAKPPALTRRGPWQAHAAGAAEMKRRGEKIVMVTAYDAPSARLADAAGVDMILVGDSAGDDRARPRLDRAGDDGRDAACSRGRCRAARRGRSSSPTCRSGRIEVSDEQAVENAIRFVQGSRRRRREARGAAADALAARAPSSTPGSR